MPKDSTIEALNELYNIIELKTDNFALNEPSLTATQYSKYKLKHKIYNIVLPHEFDEINPNIINLFIDKYTRRIERFYKLNILSNELIFIRLGTDKDVKFIDQLEEAIKLKFSCSLNKLNFINSTELSKDIKTTNWTRSEYEWSNLLYN